LNKGFLTIYFVIIIFSLILALFFVYSSHKQDELELLNEYIFYSNALTSQTVIENNVEYYVKQNIEKQLYGTQNRTIVKSIVDPLILTYLLKNNFSVSNYNTELLIEIVPIDEHAYMVIYQFVFISELYNSEVTISPGSIYGGYILV